MKCNIHMKHALHVTSSKHMQLGYLVWDGGVWLNLTNPTSRIFMHTFVVAKFSLLRNFHTSKSENKTDM